MFRLTLVLLVTVAATLVGWRLLDARIDAPDVALPLHGVTYAPWGKDQDPLEAKASGVFSFLRTAYSSEESTPQIKPRREQIERLASRVQQKGYSLVPLKLYFTRGRAKLELGIGRGRKAHDKREAITERQIKRDLRRGE